MGIEFVERPTEEHDFQIDVRKSGATVGRVRRGDGGFFQYYRGALNEVTFEFEDDDLDRLKRRIASREALATLVPLRPDAEESSSRCIGTPAAVERPSAKPRSR